MNPTEDTPTPSKLIKFEHTVGMHSDDRGGTADRRCACQDDTTSAKNAQVVDKQQNRGVQDGVQDANQLREQVEVWCAAAIPRPPATDTAYLALADKLMELFTTAQLQLVTELEGELLKHSHRMRMSGATVNAVSVGVIKIVTRQTKILKSPDTTAAGNDLPKYDPEADIKDTLRRKGEHKKQELERGK